LKGTGLNHYVQQNWELGTNNQLISVKEPSFY